MFNVLPFGLSTAPYKLLRSLVKLWQFRGFYSLVYKDDGLGQEKSYEEAEFAAHILGVPRILSSQKKKNYLGTNTGS